MVLYFIATFFIDAFVDVVFVVVIVDDVVVTAAASASTGAADYDDAAGNGTDALDAANDDATDDISHIQVNIYIYIYI